jgi:GT2 family glycosyltransferase
MVLTAAIIVPTRFRAGYLDHALASIMPQARAAGAQVIVVDDGPDAATQAVTQRHGARYVAHPRPLAINAARNSGVAAAGPGADLLCFVDDDVEVCPGWLEALLTAARACPEETGVFAGPIRPRLEGHALRSCGREGPPITFLDLGPADRDTTYAWGANLAARRSAFERAGRFDEGLDFASGDEQEWQDRVRATGGGVRYVAGAALIHRRAGDDARLRALSRAAFSRGRAGRRYDVFRGRAPRVGREVRVLAGCLVHTVRFACANGIVMAVHSAGRVREAGAPGPAPVLALAATTPEQDDFLSGASGTVGGRRGTLLAARDRLEDLRATPARIHADRAADRAAAAATVPRGRVLVIGIERPEVENRMAATRVELEATRHHDVTLRTATAGARGKFENLNDLLGENGLDGDFDWLLVVDDDVDLPRRFLDRFLFLAQAAGLRMAQPAHRLHSHAAWHVTRRRRGSLVRETNFVEIGPVTALHRDTFATLLPFPPLRMGWGLDVHWSALARAHGWPIGIVDATPVGHTLRPAAATYPRAEAIAEARGFLDGREYVRRDQVRTLRTLSSLRDAPGAGDAPNARPA